MRLTRRPARSRIVFTAAICTSVLAVSAAGQAISAPSPRAAVAGVRAADPALVAPVIACAELASPSHDFSDVPDAPTYVSSAAEVTQNGARYCEVTGYIAPQEQFRLDLPVTTYTGRYLQEGCGALCGAIPGFMPAAGNEMAVGAGNEGHAGGETDALWAAQDPALRVSFGYTSEHALAQAAKAIVTAYYGRPPAYSYYDGCSGGGREALTEARPSPRTFNGILAGAPANIDAQLLGVVPAWVITVNTGAGCREILTSENMPALHAAVIKACGNPDGLIEHPRSCGLTPATIQCPPAEDAPSCLTPAQVRVVRDFYLGPSDGRGPVLPRIDTAAVGRDPVVGQRRPGAIAGERAAAAGVDAEGGIARVRVAAGDDDPQVLVDHDRLDPDGRCCVGHDVVVYLGTDQRRPCARPGGRCRRPAGRCRRTGWRAGRARGRAEDERGRSCEHEDRRSRPTPRSAAASRLAPPRRAVRSGADQHEDS